MLARLNHVAAKAHVCFHDAVRVRKDPTGTLRFRRKLTSDLDRRWRRVELEARAMILNQDMFGLAANTVTSSLMNLFVARSVIGIDASKLRLFQDWFDQALARVVLDGEGSYLQTAIANAYFVAVGRVAKRTQSLNLMAQQFVSGNKIDTIHKLAFIELQGIVEAVSQQVVRAAGDALIKRQKPIVLVRAMSTIIRKVGVARSRDLVSVAVVRAHSEGTLDAFEAAGIEKVGVIAETVRIKPPKSLLRDARRKTGPGSRSRARVPSRSTVGRIRRLEREIEEELPRVNVLTAGDEKVCPICIEIEENGPYTIDEARGLIPAHIRCRCAFIEA